MKKEKKKKEFNRYLRFSSLGVQMGASIAFFTWLGTYLDEKQNSQTQWWTIGLSLFGVIASLLLVIREVIKLNK